MTCIEEIQDNTRKRSDGLPAWCGMSQQVYMCLPDLHDLQIVWLFVRVVRQYRIWVSDLRFYNKRPSCMQCFEVCQQRILPMSILTSVRFCKLVIFVRLCTHAREWYHHRTLEDS